MTTCKKCKCDSKYCGCADKAIPAAPPCTQGTADCPDPETCAETFSAECIVYTGDDIPQFGIKKGDRVDDIIQRIALWFLNNSCINPYTSFPTTPNSCFSVTGFRTQVVGSTFVSLVWTQVGTAGVTYTVAYSTDAVSWIGISPALPQTPTVNNHFSVGNLAPNTTYYFKIITNCVPSGSCDSLIIKVKTLIA